MSPDPPGKNWLDRLRSSRGFPPIGAELDLDQFLLLPDSNPTSDPRDIDATAASSPEKNSEKEGGASGEGRTWIEIVGGALAELFRMEDPSGRRQVRGGQKNPRKQSRPRVFGIAGGEAEDAEEKAKPSRSSGGGSDSPDLSDFSRTEVTVIDTSSVSWKSQKIIFRKGSVWKIRDKKSWIVGKKKRKLTAVKKSASDDKSTSVEICPGQDRTVLADDASASQMARYARRKHLQRLDRRSSVMDCSSPASEFSS